RVMSTGKIGTQCDGLLKLSQRCRILPTQPERPSHCPVRRRVTMVRQQTTSGCIEGSISLSLPLGGLEVKGILPMRERKPRISAGEGGIELDGALEISLRLIVIGTGEPVHVP